MEYKTNVFVFIL